MFEASPLKAKKWPFIKNERFRDCLLYVSFAQILQQILSSKEKEGA